MEASELHPPYTSTTGGMLAHDKVGRRWFVLDLSFSRWLVRHGHPPDLMWLAVGQNLIRSAVSKGNFLPFGGLVVDDVLYRVRVPTWVEENWKRYIGEPRR